MRTTFFILMVAIFAVGFIGCSTDSDPVSAVVSSDEEVLQDAKNVDRDTQARPGGNVITYYVTFQDAVYDADLDQTTFSWEVVSNPEGGPAISHWVIGFEEGCGDAGIIVDSNDPLVEWNESDPTTGVRGIKFDTGYDDNEVRDVTLTLAGEWGVDEVEIAIKSGNGFVLGSTTGPVCGGGDDEEEETYSISGVAFFDINGDGLQGVDEPGIPGVTVTLSDGSTVVTDENGYYEFTELLPGDYNVSFETLDGLIATTSTSVDVTIVDADVVVNAGFNLDFDSFCGRVADGYTIGFWKNNLRKAIDGRTRGVQVDAATLEAYVGTLSDFALAPLNIGSMQDGYDILSANGSDPVLLLSKQLMGSEFNFANGAYIDGNETLTWLFVYYGEYVIAHADDYTSSEILYAKDWFDAYNNSHGGEFFGPGCN